MNKTNNILNATKKIFNMALKIFAVIEKIFVVIKKMFNIARKIIKTTIKIIHIAIMIFNIIKKIFNMTKKIFYIANKIFHATKKIFSATPTIVITLRKSFLFVNTMVSLAEIMVSITQKSILRSGRWSWSKKRFYQPLIRCSPPRRPIDSKVGSHRLELGNRKQLYRKPLDPVLSATRTALFVLG
jgi:hypothetical protein